MATQVSLNDWVCEYATVEGPYMYFRLWHRDTPLKRLSFAVPLKQIAQEQNIRQVMQSALDAMKAVYQSPPQQTPSGFAPVFTCDMKG